MVKVYDMVTYEVCEPGDDMAPIQTSPARSADRLDLRPELGLQLYEHDTSQRRDLPPPSLQGIDVPAFLAGIDCD